MRRYHDRLVCAGIIGFVGLLLSSCMTDLHEETAVGKEMTVGIFAGEAQTRTTMLENGLSAIWEPGDEISVWAESHPGSFTLSNKIFKAYGLDAERGFFTSTLASAMPEGTYTYYCCYPAPIASSGTKVTFNVPSVQDGKASAGADVMISDPVEYGPLTAIKNPDDHSGMSLRMNRMTHQFRFYVPEDDLVLGNERIMKLVLEFPRDVVGKATLDLKDPAVPAVISEGERKITLDLASPLSTSSSFRNYACVAMVPVSFADGEMLQVKAYTASRIAKVDPIDLCARTFEAGHSTPVKLKVREIADYPYKIVFKVAANNLGEKVNSITLTAPASCKWEDQGTNVYTYAPGRKIETGEEIVFRFEDAQAFKAFSGQRINVLYDSDNALTSQSVTISDLSSSASSTISLTVPYLYFEDFSGIPSFSDGHDNPKVGASSDTYTGITELSSYSLPGWYGTRIGGQGGTAVRICCRYEHVLLAGAYYKGRIYSSFLSNIKDGKDVDITVSFRYGSNRSERDPIFGSPPKKSAKLYFGINTQDVVLNPDKSEGDLIDSITGMIAGSGFSSSTPTSLSPMVIKDETLVSTGGSYTSFEGTKTVTVTNVDNGMRLGWIVSTNNTSSNTNGNYWLYLDDIKVQIAK